PLPARSVPPPRTRWRKPRPRCRRRRSLRRSLSACGANPVAEGVVLAENQIALRVHVGVSRDFGINFSVLHVDRPFEDAADHALLPPDLARLELAVGIQTGQLGARSGAAWRTVVRLAGAQYEVLAVRSRARRMAEQLDVVDLPPVAAPDAVRFQSLAHAPCVVR